jgi:NAD(P)-dependent dehydrogenase (short-subunit alcohol dehydrogenase family)
MRLENKIAIVTGAARGIGAAISHRFALEGADVLIADTDFEGACETSKEIISKTSRRVLPFKVDVTDSQNISKMVMYTEKELGNIDILVNNAGIGLVSPVEDLKEEDWIRVLDVNLNGVFLCSQVVGKEMIKLRRGNIINVASMDGTVGLPGRSAYCTSKAGVIMFTKVLAIEWAKYNIRVNSISPGYTKTDLIAKLIAQGIFDENSIKKRCPMGRMAVPDEIATVAVFLASEESSYMTGSNVLVEGGWTSYGYL